MFPDIIIDLTPLEELITLSPGALFWFVFIHGGWVALLVALLMGLWVNWQYYRFTIWGTAQKFILLAIDVPRNNEQTPLAVENMLAQMEGSHGSQTKWNKYWHGEYQLSFSLEIVSIDGYIQFLIWTPEKWRDLMESAVYAQYPDAEINEIDDYTGSVPEHWPDPEWRFFGLEYKLKKPNPYPLRMWRDFVDPISGDFKDPMAGLMEIMGRLSPGEQVWVQYVLQPIVEKDWENESAEEVNKLLKRKGPPEKEGIFRKILGIPFATLMFILTQLNGGATEEPVKKEDDPNKTIMMQLPPGEKNMIERIENKASKHVYSTKMRVMYFARNEVYSAGRGKSAVLGAMKQFNTSDSNRLQPPTYVWTNAHYAFKHRRIARKQNKIYRAYKGRSTIAGAGSGKSHGILNIEELATMWHFPVMQVKAPLLKKTETKRREAPFSLPIARPKIQRETPSIPQGKPTPFVLPFVDTPSQPFGTPTPGGGLPIVDDVTPRAQRAAQEYSDFETEERPEERTASKHTDGPPGNLPFA